MEKLKRGEILRDARGTLWRVGLHEELHEIDESGKRLKRDTYERVANLAYLYGPLEVIPALANVVKGEGDADSAL